MSPTTRATKCFAMSTYKIKKKAARLLTLLCKWYLHPVKLKNMQHFTSDRLRSPKSLQRSQTVFNPTSRMTNRPTNFTPKAPARFTPVRESHRHQGAAKGLKTSAHRKQSNVERNKNEPPTKELKQKGFVLLKCDLYCIRTVITKSRIWSNHTS